MCSKCRCDIRRYILPTKKMIELSILLYSGPIMSKQPSSTSWSLHPLAGVPSYSLMIPASGCDHPRRADSAHRVITTIVRGTHHRVLLIPWIKLIIFDALHALIMTQPMRRRSAAIMRTTRLERLERCNGNAEVGVRYTHGFI